MELEIDTPEVFLPFFSEGWRYCGIHGGRGSGKSHFVAEAIIEAHVQGKRDTVCLREVQKSIDKSVKKLLESKIQALGVSSYFHIASTEIKSIHGGSIIFQGLQDHTADSIKSLEGFDEAWVEEAHSISFRSLSLLRPTIRKPKSRLIFTWNPEKQTDAIDSLLRGESPPARTVLIEANWRDNPFFPAELEEERLGDRARDYERYLHTWEGKYLSQSSAAVFKNWEVKEFTAPKDAIFRFGADWGFGVDPTVLIRCFIEGRKLYVDYEAYQVGCEIVDTPDLFMTVPDSERWPIIADSARPETISHMRQHGFPKIQPALKGAGSVEDGITWLQSFDIIVHPRCANVIRELTDYSYKVDKSSGNVLPLLEDKNNHTIDALRYACESARRAMKAKKETAAYSENFQIGTIY